MNHISYENVVHTILFENRSLSVDFRIEVEVVWSIIVCLSATSFHWISEWQFAPNVMT